MFCAFKWDIRPTEVCSRFTNRVKQLRYLIFSHNLSVLAKLYYIVSTFVIKAIISILFTFRVWSITFHMVSIHKMQVI